MTKLITVLSIGTCALIRAEDFPMPPDVDPLSILLLLVTNFSIMAPIAIAMSVVSIIVRVLDRYLKTKVVKKGLVVLLSVVYAIFEGVSAGLGWLEAVALVLLTSGGATAIYHWVIKPLFPPPKKELI